MAFFSNWFKEPNTANSNDSEEYTQEESEIIETFLDKYDLEEEDLIEYQLIKRTPKAFALKQLGMANEDFLAFTRWKNSTLTERIRQSFGAITSFTHFNASLLAYKDKERTEGDKNIVNDQWKYISPQEHLQEAFLLLQYCINKNTISETNIIRAGVRLYYALYTHTFTKLTPYAQAQKKMEVISVKNPLVLEIEPPKEKENRDVQ